MSHRQSCDRCRQQKVRCLRDEAQVDPSFSPAQHTLARCERCTKAGVDCVYSLKPRLNRRGTQTSTRRDNTDLNTTGWFEQGLASGLYTSGPSSLGADLADLVHQMPGVDDGFNSWDPSLLPLSPTSLNSLTGAAAVDTAQFQFSSSLSTIDDRPEREEPSDDKDLADALSVQLTCLSERARKAMRRLVRSGQAPLTVSSPEVNEALEDTNTLIRIIQSITAPDRDDLSLDPTTTEHGLAFSTLACHQHLMALFRAICDAIHRCLTSQKENQHHTDHLRGRQPGEVGPSSVAQFVMVLQLLMHLVKRMDRSLFHQHPFSWYGDRLPAGGDMEPVALTRAGHSSTDTGTGTSSPPGGLLVLVQDIGRIILDDHEKLRRAIERLQTEIEHSDLR